MSSHACGGHCCTSFALNRAPADVGALYVVTKARQAAGEDLTDFERDLLYIAEMVIRVDEDDEAFPRYTCRHFRADVGLCGAYDQRPRMCRDYPDYDGVNPCFECGFSNPHGAGRLSATAESSPPAACS